MRKISNQFGVVCTKVEQTAFKELFSIAGLVDCCRSDDLIFVTICVKHSGIKPFTCFEEYTFH